MPRLFITDINLGINQLGLAVAARRYDRIQNTESLLSVNKHRNLPYDCIKDTSKITHSIIHKNKYTYIVKHRWS